MVNPKRPDEVLNNLAPNSSGLVDLPESQVVDGVKYVLQNTEGRTYTNTLHVKPENLENYVYVPTKESTLEEGNTSASSDSSDETVSTYDVGRELSDAIVEKYPTEQELPKEEKKEAIAANLDATIALRSYFRNFVGVNPEDFAKKARTLRNRSDGRTIVIGASQHYIGAKIGAILAREGVQIQDMYELVTHLNEINPYTGRSKYYEYVADAYKELGYANSAARKLTDSFFEFIGDAHTMGIVYAVRTWESNFGLAAARVYNRKFAKAGKLAELYTATGIKLLQQELQKQGADLDTDKVADEGIKELQTLANEEVTNTEDSDVVKAYKDSVKEYLQEFSATAKGASITEADIEAALANVIRVTPDKKAIFSPSELSSSIQYALHRGYVTSKNMASVGDVITNADTVLAKVDMDYLRAVKEHSLSMLSDDGGTNLPGELIGEHLAEVFSRNGLFSNDSGNIATAQKRLIQVGLLTYAKENNLELGADWNEEQYAEALDFIKENFSISAAASQYLAYQTEYIPDNLFAAAAKNKAKLQYTIGTGSARSVLEHLADIPPQHQALAVAEPIPEQQEKPKKTEEAQPSKSAEETSEETPEESAEEEKVSLLDRILSEDDLTKYEDGKPIVLKDSAGEPKVSIFQDEDFNVHVKDLGSNEEFVIPADDPSTDELGLKLQELATESDLAQKLALNKDVLSLLANLSVKYTAPEGAEKAAEQFAEAAAGTEESAAEPEEAEEVAETAEQQETIEAAPEEEQATTEEETQETLEEVAEVHEQSREEASEEIAPEETSKADVEDGVEEEVQKEEPASSLLDTTKNAAESAFGKPLSEIDAFEFTRLSKEKDALRNLGTSEPVKQAVSLATQLGFPFEEAGELALGNFLSSLLDSNENVAKNNLALPKNRKRLVIPRAAEVNGEPGIILDTRDREGKLVSSKEIPASKLSDKDKEQVAKYIRQIQKYMPSYKELAWETLHDNQIVNELAKDFKQGQFKRFERLAPKIAEELESTFGMDALALRREASKGRYPVLKELVYKYSPPGFYLPSQVGKKFVATTPTGNTIEGKKYEEVLDKVISSLDKAVQEGKYPKALADVIKKAYETDKVLQERHRNNISKDDIDNFTEIAGTNTARLIEDVKNALETEKLTKTETPPDEYINDKFAQTLRMLGDRLDYEYGIRDIKTSLPEDGASEEEIRQSIEQFDKYLPGLGSLLSHTYDQLKNMAEEYKDIWERKVEENKARREAYKQRDELRSEAQGTYRDIFKKLGGKRRMSAKTALNKLSQALSEVDGYLNKLEELGDEDSKKTSYNNVYRYLKQELEDKGVSIPDVSEISSLTDYAPYLLAVLNDKRKNSHGVEFTGADDVLKEIIGTKTEGAEQSQQEQEKPTESEEATSKEKEQPVEEKKKEEKLSTPAKSNVDAVFNTILEKYASGKKAPTEGRVRRTLNTQLSKLFGGNPEQALDTLNDYFNTSADSYDDLLNELAQRVVDAYDERRSEQLKEAAKKTKESSGTKGDKLPSGFDASEVKQGLANFIENYPIPPKAVEDMIDKYGSDFSEWSNDALEELGRRLRKDFGNNSIGQSIQEFFPKGFVVQEQIPEKEEEQESEDLEFSEEPEGPTEEDLEELENEEE